ncbi:amino acid permease [Halobacteriovorax sp. RZ-1]|uniref:amino acid permease n=1 Tax=unclassified Halobacteriovorax TaxID=2639665 RepID=UPI0037123422
MKKLERNLGLSSVISISIASMLGSGIFVLPGLAFEVTGPYVWISYLLAGLCVLPAALSKSELATAMPASGGTYIYIERTFGPMAGTIAGLGLWISLLLKAAFALMGFGAYLGAISAGFDLKNFALILTAIITILNIVGVGKVSGLLIAVVLLSTIGLTVLNIGTLSTAQVITGIPFSFSHMDSILLAAGLVFISYAGVTKVAAIAEEIKTPEKNLPRGILLSLLIVTLLYCVTTLALAKYLPIEQLKNNLRPIYTLAYEFGGKGFGMIMAVLAILTMTSMANAGLLAASRFPFAMSRDHLIPRLFGHLDRRFLTPVWSILASGLVVACAIYFLNIAKIAKLASAFILTIYMIENIAVIALRETHIQWYKPTYKSPLYPYVQIFGIISTLYLLVMMKDLAVIGLVSISVPGILIYLFYAKGRVSRKGVLGIRGKRTDLVNEAQFPAPAASEKLSLDQDANVVVALVGNERSPEMLIDMGTTLAGGEHIEVAHLTEAPEQTDLNDFTDEDPKLRSLRRRVIAMAIEKTTPINFDPIVTHDLSKSIFEIGQRLHCNWLFMEWKGRLRDTFTTQSPVAWLRSHLNCHLAIFRDNGVRYMRKIMVLIDQNSNDVTLIQAAQQIAESHKAEITFIYLIDKDLTIEETSQVEKYIRLISDDMTVRTTGHIIKYNDKVDTLETLTVEYDLLVFNSNKKHRWFHVFGTEDDQIMAKASCSVLGIHTGSAN